MEKQHQAYETWVHHPKPLVTEAAPSEQFPSPWVDHSDTIGRGKSLFNLVRRGLKMDSTRVDSVFLKGMDLKPPIAGVSEDHHGLTHHGRNPAKIEQLRLVEGLEMAAFRDFLIA